jgi:hypothetical protein
MEGDEVIIGQLLRGIDTTLSSVSAGLLSAMPRTRRSLALEAYCSIALRVGSLLRELGLETGDQGRQACECLQSLAERYEQMRRDVYGRLGGNR